MKPGKGMGMLALIGAPKGKPGEDEEEPDATGGALSASKALIKAVKADDAEGVDEALRLHYDLCAGESEED